MKTNVLKFCNDQGIITSWPTKFSLRVEVSEYLSSKFDYNYIYSEQEINEILSSAHSFNNYVALRRELVDFQFLKRQQNGSRYWKAHRYLDQKIETSNLFLEECDSQKRVLPKNRLLEFCRFKKIITKNTSESIGFLDLYLGYPDQKTIWISAFFIDKKHQNLGYENEIIETLSQHCGIMGIEALSLALPLKDLPVFWTQNNFQETIKNWDDSVSLNDVILKKLL